MQHQSISIPIESRLSIQIFESQILPYLTIEEITSKLIGLNYQWLSAQQAIAKPRATSLQGRYLVEHEDFMDKAPRIPLENAKHLLIQLMYMNSGINATTQYLDDHWRIH